MKIGLYIHIPFCQKKCLYCDFPSYESSYHLYEEYMNALRREIAGQGVHFSGVKIDTIYIGGGTPTTLTGSQLSELLAALYQHFNLEANAEISIEANPGTVDFAKLSAIRAAGVNRISFGIQSFNDELLTKIGRIHTAAQGIQAVELARSAGFANINIDLMYGLPSQELDDLKASLAAAVSLKVPHLSVYGLKVEEGTPFGDWQAQGLLNLPSEDIEEAMYDWTVKFLSDNGWHRYEISNYALPGYECRHNLKYWHYQPYLGLGAAAHSFVNGERFANIGSIEGYIVALREGKPPVVEREKPDRNTAMAEYVFLGLRTTDGIKLRDFDRYFGTAFYDKFGQTVKQLVEKRLLTCSAEGVRLTPLGMKYGNRVFAAFLPDEA